MTEGAPRWAAAFALILALHVGVAAYLLAAARDALDGTPGDAINVELMPDFSTADAKPDDLTGPTVPEQAMPTSDKAQADDPNPPAPDAPPPTEAKREADTPPEAAVPPSPDARAELQEKEKHEERPPDEKPPVEKTPDAKPDKVEQTTAPSRASSGSAALLGGGRRPSPAAQKSWRGDIGTHLVQKRRYPQEARSKGWQGIARVRVTIDGNGHVLGRELVKSTGKPILDDEALALMQRSDPFPKPPTGMPAPIVMTVPVNFAIH